MDISKTDKNFDTSYRKKDGIVYYPSTDEIFSLYGVYPPDSNNGGFYRMDRSVAEKCNSGVASLNNHTAGGRIRFKTDSSEIHINAVVHFVSRMSHMAFTGSSGFDLYQKTDDGYKYLSTFFPPVDIDDGCEFKASAFVGEGEVRDYTINFPLYCGVKSLEIGLKEGSVTEKAPSYKNKKRIVYYGSSITQGGCASRPGNAYQSIVTRYFDCDHLNLGFSGSAKGEIPMAEYIRDLNGVDVFVCDYDHNAPTAEHLRETLLPFVKKIREKKQDIPVIFMSRPQPNPTPDDLTRRDIVKNAYSSLKENGDGNVYFIDGTKIIDGISKDSATVDNCHPNDFGFMCMARAVIDMLEKIGL